MAPTDRSSDVAAILARRNVSGGDFWATPDGRIYVGNPFSTLSSLNMLHELGVGAGHEAVDGALALVLNACRADGKIRLGPKAPLYPCYTAEAARILCRFGLERHASVERTVSYLLASDHESGGWRCNFTRFGKGPETECANPGATLYALDVLRFHNELRSGNPLIDRAVEFLLGHWETRQPMGPCHWGIGTQFLQVEYPFLRYNLFYWVYVLSFFARAREDPRFLDALEQLTAKLDERERMVVERPHRGLAGLDFCARGAPSEPATDRFQEIVHRIECALEAEQ